MSAREVIAFVGGASVSWFVAGGLLYEDGRAVFLAAYACLACLMAWFEVTHRGARRR